MNGEQIIKLCLSMALAMHASARRRGKAAFDGLSLSVCAKPRRCARILVLFRSQRSYRLVNELAQRLTQVGIPARGRSGAPKAAALKYGLGVRTQSLVTTRASARRWPLAACCWKRT
jgi:hypothetical protein